MTRKCKANLVVKQNDKVSSVWEFTFEAKKPNIRPKEWRNNKMREKICNLMLMILAVLCFSDNTYAARAEIRGEYCYQYGDSESLMIAKEISYAMALRQAIETYRTFVASSSVVKDYQLRKDLVETIASGYVEDIKIVRQDVQGRMVCTALIGYVNPEAVKNIITIKVKKMRDKERQDFGGLLSDESIKILNYRKVNCRLLVDEKCMVFTYQAKKNVPNHSLVLIVDCFDKDGNRMKGTRIAIPSDDLYTGEVREGSVVLPKGTISFKLRFLSR